jgi:hypothetical protein
MSRDYVILNKIRPVRFATGDAIDERSSFIDVSLFSAKRGGETIGKRGISSGVKILVIL